MHHPGEGLLGAPAKPHQEEIDGLNTRFALDPTYLAAALDEEESARIEHEGDQTLIIVDIPYVESEGSGYIYSTIPLGIVLVDDIIITVCTRDTPIIADFYPGAGAQLLDLQADAVHFAAAAPQCQPLPGLSETNRQVQHARAGKAGKEQPQPGAFADDEAGEIPGVLLHLPEGQ